MKINVLVVPNSKDSGVIKVDEITYKVRVDAPALDGKANKRLIEILAEHFNVSKSSIKILKGFKNRNKIVSIDNL
jgi:uncharacterized protein (TIGR00251 family)